MNKYIEKCQRIDNHLRSHPADWQSKISLFKNESKAVQYEMDSKRYEKLAQLAHIRRASNAEQTQ